MTSEDEPMTDEQWTATIEQLCTSKAEEFRLIGYEHVTGNEVWQCVNDKYAKTGQPARHQVVNDILSLKVTKFMNFLTLSAYKGTHF
ncbi:post-transcriptional regulator [Paenibacillus sp. R14(2021)]|uniref:post-transcriptional regulator n=1 Tax=Paenibacillus sp. R14(2021) TaxID=2859228 RepID=UPI001C61384B|nr:post-transcriptional regulator [Paenibacillus sp. R14(2021)]